MLNKLRFFCSEIIHQINSSIHIERNTCSNLSVNCQGKVMLKFERSRLVVLLDGMFPEFLCNLNVLDTVVQHLLGILFKIFEVNLVVSKSPAPGFERS